MDNDDDSGMGEQSSPHHDSSNPNESRVAKPEGNGSMKKARRGKEVDEKRDHFCGCGKKYLSYPALYTHLKQKHGGIAPPGSSKQNSQSGKTGRGRPPKVDPVNRNDL
jgi:hypothetical protein